MIKNKSFNITTKVLFMISHMHMSNSSTSESLVSLSDSSCSDFTCTCLTLLHKNHCCHFLIHLHLILIHLHLIRCCWCL